MKQLKTKWCMLFVFMLLVSAIVMTTPLTQADAATKKETITLIAGEKWTGTGYYKIKSITSSNKSVVAVAKDKKNKASMTMTAKKKGSATVTVKYSNTKDIFKIKVKVEDLDVEIRPIGKTDEKVFFEIKNNTSVSFHLLPLTFTLVDTDGNEVQTEQDTLRIAAKKTGYHQTMIHTDLIDKGISIDLEKTTGCASATPSRKGSYTRIIKDTFLDRTDKVKLNKTANEITWKNTSDEDLELNTYIFVYDKEGQLENISHINIAVGKKASRSLPLETYLYKNYGRYEVINGAYYQASCMIGDYSLWLDMNQ